MGLMINTEKFDTYRKKLEESQKQTSSFNAENYIDFKPGNTFKFRLIYFENPDSSREGPFIEKWVHSVKEENKWFGITCPTTQFPKTGFEKCPICTNNSKLWASELKTDKALYDKFKRRFNGYALVYVVNDPVKPTNNNHVKIMRFGITIHNWLNKEIFGIISSKKRKNDEAVAEEVDTEPVGFDAFKLKDGYDLFITVTEKGEYNDYDCKFSRKATSIETDEAALEAEIKALNFDRELTSSTPEEISSFFNRFVLDNTPPPAASSDLTVESNEGSTTIAQGNVTTPVTTPVATAPAVAAPTASQPAAAASAPKAEDDENIDALLAEIQNELNK